MSCRLGPRRRRRSDLNGQQNRTVSPARFRSSRLPSPCEEQALRNAVSPRHLAHHGPRHQRLFNDPRLLVLAPTPSALDPENLPIHLCMTLRLAQRSYPSRRTPSQQGGRRRTNTARTWIAGRRRPARARSTSQVKDRADAGDVVAANERQGQGLRRRQDRRRSRRRQASQIPEARRLQFQPGTAVARPIQRLVQTTQAARGAGVDGPRPPGGAASLDAQPVNAPRPGKPNKPKSGF